ncbi:MAG: B12-binding domain-containing radical SAM protein [Planctomycetota bacterium]
MTGESRTILLVEPPFGRLFKPTYSLERFPLSLAYLAGAVLRDTNWRVRAVNADFTPRSEPISVRWLAGKGFARYRRALEDPRGGIWDELRSVLERVGPDVVGISATSQTFASARVVARLARETGDPLVIVGGPHPSLVGAEALSDEFDVAVRGEGERTLVELLGAVEDGRDLAGIDGLVYRNGGTVAETPPREPVADLDALGFAHAGAAALVGRPGYPPGAFRYVFATRGCPYNCFFCGSRGVWGRRVRFRTPGHVAAELRALRRMGVRQVHFDDDTFGVDRAYLRELCRAIRTDCPRLLWSCEMHVKGVDDDALATMRRSGCCSVQLGIESGNDEMLRVIGKDITADQALAACRAVRRHRMELVAFFMVGFPDETEATLDDTAAAMSACDADVLVYSIFTPYPGTEAYASCRARGLIGDDYDPAMHHHQSPANCFCEHIPPERFRRRVERIEAMVDRHNAARRRRRLFSRRALGRLRELGLGESLRRAGRILRPGR